jgi:hypothetical protein
MGLRGIPSRFVAQHTERKIKLNDNTPKNRLLSICFGGRRDKKWGGLDSRGPAVEVRLAVVLYEELEVHITGVCPLLHGPDRTHR